MQGLLGVLGRVRSGRPCPASAGVHGEAVACGSACRPPALRWGRPPGRLSREQADGGSGRAQVSLTADFSACRVYWKATPRAERDARAGAALRRSAAQMR